MSEEEQEGTMKVTRFNGECWYEEGAAECVLKWICWPGGWFAHRRSRYFSLRQRLRPGMLTPLSFFGHRLTFFGWGIQLRIRCGYLVYSTCRGSRQVYWSPDGTPSKATVWLLNAPLSPVARVTSEAEGAVDA